MKYMIMTFGSAEGGVACQALLYTQRTTPPHPHSLFTVRFPSAEQIGSNFHAD
jgi:hypothetical protein